MSTGNLVTSVKDVGVLCLIRILAKLVVDDKPLETLGLRLLAISFQVLVETLTANDVAEVARSRSMTSMDPQTSVRRFLLRRRDLLIS